MKLSKIIQKATKIRNLRESLEGIKTTEFAGLDIVLIMEKDLEKEEKWFKDRKIELDNLDIKKIVKDFNSEDRVKK